MVAWTGTPSVITNSTGSGTYNFTTSTTSTANTWVDIDATSLQRAPTFRDVLLSNASMHIWPKNTPGKLHMLDGSIIDVDDKGNYTINDKNSKTIYKANRIREFNKFLNASDLLEEFIRDAGQYGVRQKDVMEGLFGIFLNWLIVKAAEADGDTPPEGILPIEQNLIESKEYKPVNCRLCGKFIKRDLIEEKILFCSKGHVALFTDRILQNKQ